MTREPAPSRLRPTGMRRIAVLGLLALALAGCGNAADRESPPRPAPRDAHTVVAGCRDTDADVVRARTLGRADLDGDGSPETLRLTGPGGSCPDVVFARVGGGYAAYQLGGVQISGTTTAVRLPGRAGDLVLARQVHPRGGFQVHLLALSGRQLAELTTDRHAPVVPFVALDTEAPLSAGCARGAVTVTEARPTEPPGVMFAWDVFTTSYAVHGATVTAGPTRKVRTSVPDRELKRQRPDLFRHAMFAGCRG